MVSLRHRLKNGRTVY